MLQIITIIVQIQLENFVLLMSALSLLAVKKIRSNVRKAEDKLEINY